MGAFPNLSRNVPFCPRLSSFVLLGARNGDKSGQKRTNGDRTGHFGTHWETPPFSICPHLALLNMVKRERHLLLSFAAATVPNLRSPHQLLQKMLGHSQTPISDTVVAKITMRAGINAFRIPGEFLTYMYAY